MAVRGSQNHVWFLGKPLGSGATGNVYVGRHKRQGTLCAVKVFTDLDRREQIRIKTLVLELTRKLDHKNVVKFIAIEQETHTKDEVLIMEYCTERSVNDMLSLPDYAFGFPESLFITFVLNIACGLECLHKNNIQRHDIKPGKILCTKTDEGRHEFKLADYGASTIPDDDRPTSTPHGSEDYLPSTDIYGSALLEAKDEQRKKSNWSSMWNIAATLYHVLTGQRPFQTYGGRDSKEDMYKILKAKPDGSISGVQTESDGRVTYSNSFPDTCRLSRGLFEIIQPVIARALVRKPDQQLTFNDFFITSNMLSSLNVYHAVSLETPSQQYRFYLPEGATYVDLQTVIARQSNIAIVDQIVSLGDSILSDDVIGSKDVISKRLHTNEERPLVFARRPNSSRDHVIQQQLTNVLPKIPATPEIINNVEPDLDDDAKWSRDVCALLVYLKVNHLSFVRHTEFMIEFRRNLSEHLVEYYVSLKTKFDDVSRLLQIATSGYEAIPGDNKQQSLNIPTLHRPTSPLSRDTGLGTSLMSSDSPRTMTSQAILLGTTIEGTGRRQMLINSKLQSVNGNLIQLKTGAPLECECKSHLTVMSTYVDHARTIQEQFAKDVKSTLSYNELQVHKYERTKMEETKRKALRLYNDKCYSCTQRMFSNFQNWIWNSYGPLSVQLQDIRKNLETLKEDTMKIRNLRASQIPPPTVSTLSEGDRKTSVPDTYSQKYTEDLVKISFIQETVKSLTETLKSDLLQTEQMLDELCRCWGNHLQAYSTCNDDNWLVRASCRDSFRLRYNQPVKCCICRGNTNAVADFVG